MKKSLVILSTALAVFASTSCNGNNPPVRPNPPVPPVTPSTKVTEAEWNAAIENIVIVDNEKECNLNYISKGDITITLKPESEEETVAHFNHVEMNGNYGYACEIDTYKDPYEIFTLKKGHTYLEVKIHDGELSGNISNRPVCNIFDEFLDLYGNMSAFEFTNNRYIIKNPTIETGKTYVEVAFNDNKKISQLVVDYDLVDSGDVLKMKGILNFAYGNSTLSIDSFPEGWKDLENKYYISLQENNSYTNSFIIDDDVVINIDIGSSPVTDKTLLVNYYDGGYFYPFREDDEFLVVYKNNVKLSRGVQGGEVKDYYLTDKSPNANKYRKLTFTADFAPGDKIEMHVWHGTFYSAISNAQVSLTD